MQELKQDFKMNYPLSAGLSLGLHGLMGAAVLLTALPYNEFHPEVLVDIIFASAPPQVSSRAKRSEAEGPRASLNDHEIPRPTPKSSLEMTHGTRTLTPLPGEYNTKPDYPEEARASGLEGNIKVRIIVHPSGNVSEVTPLEPLGHPVFQEAVISTVKQWKFSPFQGIAHRSIEQDFRFSLEDGEA